MINRTSPALSLGIWLVYATLVSLAIVNHEPWFDEAQAWLLGRDTQTLDLLTKHLRYEGSPGLWHLLLVLPAKSGLPYATLHVLSGLSACFGIYLLLRHSPFPRLVKILLPFSYFLFYQYAVVARSYVLLPPLLFLTAMLYPQRRQSIGRYQILLALLANTSLHGFIVAVSLAALDLLDFLRQRQSLSLPLQRRTLFGYGLLGLLGLALLWQLRLPADHAFVRPQVTYDLASIFRTGQKFLNNAFTERRTLTDCVLVFSVWHFWRTRTLSLFVLPVLGLSHLYNLAYANVWHQGVLFLVWIFCLWVSFDPRNRQPELEIERPWLPPSLRMHEKLALAGLTLVLLVQLSWSIGAFQNDRRHPYSAAKNVADYLKSQQLWTKTIYAAGFHTVAILPYFPRNIFANYGWKHGYTFWDWSLSNDMVQNVDRIRADAPDVIIYGIKSGFKSIAPIIPGYRPRKFTGFIYWKDRALEEDSYVVYEKINIRSEKIIIQSRIQRGQVQGS